MKKVFALMLALVLVLSMGTVLASAEEIYGENFAWLGDVNLDGTPDAADALTVLRHAVWKDTLTPLGIALGDVSDDGVIDATDALLILKYAVGKITEYPGGYDCLEGNLPEASHYYYHDNNRVASGEQVAAKSVEFNAEVLAEINYKRTLAGMNPLVLNADLTKAAGVLLHENMMMGVDIANQDLVRADGYAVWSVFEQYGFSEFTDAAYETIVSNDTVEGMVNYSWGSVDSMLAQSKYEEIGMAFVYDEDTDNVHGIYLLLQR